MHAKSGGSSGEPPDFLFIPAACRSRKDLPRSAGGETGRGTRATVRGTQKTEPRARARARGAGRGRRGHGRRVRGRGCGTRKTRAWGAGRKTRNTWTRTRARARGHGGTGARGHGVQDAGRRTQDAERRTQNAGRRTRATGRGQQNTGNAGTGRRRRGIGDEAQAPVHGTQRDRIRPARPRNNRPGPFTAGRLPPPGPIRRDLSRLDARRRDPQQPAGAIHSRAPSATGTCNNRPGPFTAGRLPPRAAATCRAYESESRRCRRARRTCCCRAAPRPT